MTKKNSVFHKALSVVLTVVMVFGYVGLLSGVIGKDLFGTGLTASAVTSDVVIAVPETVYMQPQANFSDTTAVVQYYVNNKINASGGIDVLSEHAATSGRFYVYGSSVNSVKNVSVNGAALGSFATTKSGNLIYDESFTLTLSTPIASKATTLLEWKIDCNMVNGTVETFYAYTVAYNPYLAAVVSLGSVVCDRWNNHQLEAFAWTSGIHGIEADGNWYSIAGCSPLGHTLTTGGGDSGAEDEWTYNNCIFSSVQFGQDKKNAYYYRKKDGHSTGRDSLEVQEVTPWGLLTVDTSRNSNLSTIPNITTGFHVTDTGTKSKQPDVYGYICNLTEDIATQKDNGRITSGNHLEHSSTIMSWYKERGTILWGNNNDEGQWIVKSDSCRETQSVLWNCSVTGTGLQYCYTKSGLYSKDGSEDDRCFLNLVGRVKVTKVDKSALRNAVIQYTGKYWRQNCTVETWNNFKNKLYEAGQVLGNPCSTQDQINAAKNNLDAAAVAIKTHVFYNYNYDNNSINTNLWAPVQTSTYSNGLTCTYNENTGIIKLNGTQTASTGTLLQSRFVPAPGTYTVSVEQVGGSKTAGNGCVVLDMRSESGNNLSTRCNTDFNGSTSSTFTITEALAAECTRIDLWVWHNSAVNTFNDFQFRVKVERASAKTDMSANGKVITIGTANTVNHTNFPAAPDRTGYEFKGWNASSAATTGSNSINVDFNQTVYCIWDLIESVATFQWNNKVAGMGSPDVTDQDYDVNTTFRFPQNCSKPYYTFTGKWKVTTPGGNWSRDAEYDQGAVSPAGKYGNPTFSAQYTPIPYEITFDPNGGGDVPSNYDPDHISNKFHYTYESTDTLPATGRLGYTFGGWQPTSTVTEEWDSSQIVWDENATYTGTSLKHKHGDVTLVARWNTVSSNVHYVLGTGESLTGADLNPSYSFQSPSNFALDTATKTGYEFVGWRIIAPSGSGNTYYDNYYTQYYADNGVKVPPANRWAVSEDEGEIDYRLDSGSFVLPQGKIGDVWLAPEFTPITYTLIYNANGGSACAPITYTIESNLTLASTSLKGYDFSGWTAALTNAGSGEAHNWTASSYNFGAQLSGMYGNVTLTAQMEPVHYTITLDVNGGDPLADNTLDYTIKTSTALPQPTRTGFTFLYWEVAGGDDLANPSTWYDDLDYTRQYTDTLPYGCYGNVKLVAQWEHTAYRIDKDGFGEQTYYIDVPFTLGSATQPGYTFVNWNVVANAGNWVKDVTYTATQNISGMFGNVTLHPNFTANDYTITFKDKNGDTTNTVSYTIEDPITLPDGTVDGYDFGGWLVSDVDGSDSAGWSNGTDMEAGVYDAGQYYGNVTLSPILTPVNYTVTYLSDGGTTYPQLPYTIEGAAEGFDDTLPEPTKTGYDFAGWKVTTAAGNWDDGAVIPAGTSVVGKWGSVTLTAQWSAKSIPVKYIVAKYPDGITKQGTFNETAPDLTDEEKAKPADAQYTYTFDHWEPALGKITRENPQYVYTAVYSQTVNKYTVTWMIPTDVNGAPGNYTAQVSDPIEYGNAPVYNDGVNPTLESANPAEYTWRFAGWSLTPGGEKLESLPAVTGNATYYALYTKVLRPEIVNWVINGVTNQEEWGIGEIPEWKHDTPTRPDENGYAFTFTNWDPTPSVVEQNGGPYTYTAQFSSELQTYTVTLNANGGETADPLSFTYQMGDVVTFPNPTRTGFTFAGWQLDAAVGTWTARTVPAGQYTTNTLWGSVSFTALWTPIEYTVSFNGASEYDELPDPLTYTIESDNMLPPATREGHVLSGWIVSVGGGNWTQGATIAAAYQLAENYGDVTLTPVWQVQTYTIHWISGDYEQTSEAEYGSAILAYTPISKMGYTADWDAEVPATMPASDLTFHAVYTPVQYYIRLNANGGSEVENFYYTIDGNNTLPTPTRDGATFRGWKVTAAQGNWSKNTLVAGGASLNGKYGNVSLTAQWDLEPHTVTWVAGDVTKETVWLYGATPSYDGTPYKSPDEHNSYVFSGWDKTIVPVTEDVTYTALFTPTVRTYTVRWVVDGFIVKEKTDYRYGDMPVFDGETPTRASTPYFDFTFSGWSPEVSKVTKDITYVAQFDVFTKLQNLTLDISSMFLEIDGEETLGVTLNPTNASVRDVLWTSQNTDVATIDANGKITAVGPGVSVIKVASVDNSKSAYCVVTVSPRHTKYVEITAGGISTTQLAGAMLQLSATIQPDNATDTGIRWSSGDVSVATVDGNGLVKYVGVGETDITAIASDGFSKGSIHVVTTTDETEVENEVKTYLVTFGEFYPGFKFTENGEHYTAGRLYVAEGETIRFKLDVQNSRQNGYSVYANTELMSCDGEYWYTLDNIQNNMIIRFADSAAGIGTPEEEDGGDSGAKLTFFERLAAFFRKIVEFFRGLFKK